MYDYYKCYYINLNDIERPGHYLIIIILTNIINLSIIFIYMYMHILIYIYNIQNSKYINATTINLLTTKINNPLALIQTP